MITFYEIAETSMMIGMNIAIPLLTSIWSDTRSRRIPGDRPSKLLSDQ